MYFGIKENGISLGEIVQVTGGTAFNIENSDKCVYNICTDTRKDVSSSLFVALIGENFNGHDFVVEAFRKGALCALVSRDIDAPIPYIKVDDTLSAYGKIAAAYKRKFNVLTVAVTGSVGKTTTKEAVCAVLESKYKTCKTEANFNNEVGLPKTLLSLDASHKAAVIEMGMCAKGELTVLSGYTAPDISIITNIGSSHIGLLGSHENILKAKLEIQNGMSKDAVLLLSGDDDMLLKVESNDRLCLFVGIDNPNCDFLAHDIKLTDNGMIFDFSYFDDTIKDLFIPSIGKHIVRAGAFAAACGVLCGLNENDIRRGLSSYAPVAMRQRIVERNGYTIIEDCYNASPESMRAALDVLRTYADMHKKRAVAVLGEMRDLGSYGKDMHFKVGEYAAKKADTLFVFGNGENELSLVSGFERSGKKAVMIGSDHAVGAERLKAEISDKDVVLIKASRAVRLEKLSEKI